MFTVYSKPNCVYCDKAKFLLKNNDLLFKTIELDVGQSKNYTISYISKSDFFDLLPDARTMPQIFFNDDYIGGYEDLVKFLTK